MALTQRAIPPGARRLKMNVRTLMTQLAEMNPDAEVVVFQHCNGEEYDLDVVVIRADLEDDDDDRPRRPGKHHPSDILLAAGPDPRI